MLHTVLRLLELLAGASGAAQHAPPLVQSLNSDAGDRSWRERVYPRQ